MILRDLAQQEHLNLQGVRVWNHRATRAGTIVEVWAEFHDPDHPDQTGPYLCIQWDDDLQGLTGRSASVSHGWLLDLEIEVVVH